MREGADQGAVGLELGVDGSQRLASFVQEIGAQWKPGFAFN